MLNDGVPRPLAAASKGTPAPSQGSANAPAVAETAAVVKQAGVPVTPATAVALAIANMIGIGVFTSLGFQVHDLPSGFTLLMLWVLGGLISLCGGLCYAELAAAFPRSGGEYSLLSMIYHRSIGFLAGWVSATVGFSAPTAVAAMAFSGYLAGAWPEAPQVTMALVVVWAVTLVHLRGTVGASAFQNVATLFKVGLIVGLIVAAVVYGERQPLSFAPSMEDLSLMVSPPFAISLTFVMYSYAGWNAVTYIAGEVREPSRTVPISVIVACVVVTLLYVGLNAVFLITTPMEQMAGEIRVAAVAGQHIFGETGARIVDAVICVGLISTISAMMWLGPRVTMAMGEDFGLLSAFARKTRGGVPATAIVFQLVVVSLLLFTQSFESIVEFIQFSLTISSFLTVLGVIVLRFTQPALRRPYKVWGYPLTPLLFLAVSLFMMVNLVLERPAEALAGIGIMLSGLLVYAISARNSRSHIPGST
ncbi:MAG TPA: amino acid permease [Hyphomicrobiaceae bacterium]|nr:amino acid permease [Hyphomicrobiaceae bacterium]